MWTTGIWFTSLKTGVIAVILSIVHFLDDSVNFPVCEVPKSSETLPIQTFHYPWSLFFLAVQPSPEHKDIKFSVVYEKEKQQILTIDQLTRFSSSFLCPKSKNSGYNWDLHSLKVEAVCV